MLCYASKIFLSPSKIVVFRKSGRLSGRDKWYYDGEPIEVVNSFNYLGLTLNYTGNFQKTQLVLASQGQKCIYSLYKKFSDTYFNHVKKLSLFDTYVECVLNYAGEVWGLYKSVAIERVHLAYLKRCLYVKKSTPNMMIYSELGRMPLIFKRKMKLIKYWLKLVNTENCILKELYKDNFERILYNRQNSVKSWLYGVRNLLCSIGLGEVWFCHNITNIPLFLSVFENRLKDEFIQERNGFFESSSKCSLYRHIVDDFHIQSYLSKSLNIKNIRLITKYRLSSHRLFIETGRYTNIPRENRICALCNYDIEDEFHFILKCPFYNELRKHYIKPYFWKRPSVYKLVQIFTTDNVTELNNLGIYLKKCEILRNNLLV